MALFNDVPLLMQLSLKKRSQNTLRGQGGDCVRADSAPEPPPPPIPIISQDLQ